MPLSLPFFKFNVTDWLTSHSVTLMTNAQRGVYIMLLSHQWANANCTIDSDVDKLKRLTQWTGSEDEFLGVLECFKAVKKYPGRRMNPRLYAEWLEAKARTERLSEGGVKGAEKRWAPKTSTVPLSNGVATWESYARAYTERYHSQPVRNRMVNSQLKQFVERLGVDEAPQVAAFYLTHNKPLYVSARHPTNLLLRDAEGLRTEWATGIKSTTLEARSAETVDASQEQVNRVRRLMKGDTHGSA